MTVVDPVDDFRECTSPVSSEGLLSTCFRHSFELLLNGFIHDKNPGLSGRVMRFSCSCALAISTLLAAPRFILRIPLINTEVYLSGWVHSAEEGDDDLMKRAGPRAEGAQITRGVTNPLKNRRVLHVFQDF